MNFKQTHRCTTVMREAMEKGVRQWANKQGQKVFVTPVVGQIADALHANAGVIRRPDVSLNLTGKTYKTLERQGAFA